MNQSNIDLLTYKNLPLAGKVICDKKKEDVTQASKPKVIIPSDLKRLNAGHRCKAASKLITKTPLKEVEDKISA